MNNGEKKIFINDSDGIKEIKGILFTKEDKENINILVNVDSKEEMLFLMQNILNLKQHLENNKRGEKN